MYPYKNIQLSLNEEMIMALTFRGGIHVAEHKHTANCAIEPFEAPELVYLPMQQHIGAQAKPLVAVGDKVLCGQVIGLVEAGLGAPIHASVSGTVEAIKSVNDAQGRAIQTVVIRNDFENTLSPDIKPFAGEVTLEALAEIVKNAGIAGLGGATFPTHVKIISAKGKAEHIIINCAECEPYITANHRLMLENPKSIISGLTILLDAYGIDDGILAVEDNKPDAIKLLTELTKDLPRIKVKVLKTKYPQGDERQLIYALFGKELPTGKLPADLGCVIFNAETCSAIDSAVTSGMPLVRRVVTVDGDCVANPKNLLVPLGTPFSALLAHCGLKPNKTLRKVVSGGPMMGQAQYDIDTPVVKGTAAILALSKDNDTREVGYSQCIRCGRCLAHCPMHLPPLYMMKYAKAEDFAEAEAYGAMSCVECGSCSYICPASVPILQYIRIAKQKIGDERRKKAAAQKAAEEAKAKEKEVIKQ